jgi:hypothetical protein
MENLEELTKSATSPTNFLKHVFNFNNQSKNEMMNIIQYSIIAIIPVVILNKLMQRYVPEADEDKGNLELIIEILGQVIIIFIGILIIHRIITYIPTYSGSSYVDFSVTNIVLSVLIIILSLQTKLGDKVSILVDRFFNLWDGNKQVRQQKQNNDNNTQNIRINQPISQNQITMSLALKPNSHGSGTTSINDLPQQGPNFDAMYRQDTNPLVNAATPGGMENFSQFNDILPANEGGAFASPFGSNW